MPVPPSCAIHPLRTADLDAVLCVQAQCYGPGFLEPIEAFASKLAASPHTSWVAWAEGEPIAYLVCLPVEANKLPALHASDWQAPTTPTALYLHDMAVAPAGRALGLGRQLVATAKAEATRQGLNDMTLVAVQGSVPYWQRHGFMVVSGAAPSVADKVASFGPDARLMHCALR
jgi:predicted N-acetyltransferase YhbS